MINRNTTLVHTIVYVHDVYVCVCVVGLIVVCVCVCVYVLLCVCVVVCLYVCRLLINILQTSSYTSRVAIQNCKVTNHIYE